jgi:predicted transcriptional regulator
MGQDDINNFLRRYRNKWFSSNELAEVLKVSKSSINRCLGRMRKHEEVNEKTVKVVLRSGYAMVYKGVPLYSFKKG